MTDNRNVQSIRALLFEEYVATLLFKPQRQYEINQCTLRTKATAAATWRRAAKDGCGFWLALLLLLRAHPSSSPSVRLIQGVVRVSMTRHSNNNSSDNFRTAKEQCLGWKRDKSSAGRIDPRAVEVCAVINELPQYYTTSSCAGRCFLYTGRGAKGGGAATSFRRFRVSHGKIAMPDRYFDLSTLDDDLTGGSGDPVPEIGQYERRQHQQEQQQQQSAAAASVQRSAVAETDKYDVITADDDERSDTTPEGRETPLIELNGDDDDDTVPSTTTWLRFEPFILHVACRSAPAAAALMNAARPSFKNVGLTTWRNYKQQRNNVTRSSNSSYSSDGKISTSYNNGKYLVAIWGDEGLDMPLSTPDGVDLVRSLRGEWLASLVNERHDRNWDKIDRFVRAVRDGLSPDDDIEEGGAQQQEDGFGEFDPGTTTSSGNNRNSSGKLPRSFDVIGDIAVLNALSVEGDAEQRHIGESIMKKNKAIKVVAARRTNLEGTERAPGRNGYKIVAGAANRNPLVTTHSEYGIKCVVDLTSTFFSPRMGRERLRICQQVGRGERVLVLFAGVALDALQIAGRTEATSVQAIEMNPKAVECARRAHQILGRNKAVKCAGAADRLEIVEGDVLQVVPTLPRNHFDRVLAPRPKEGALDGDLGTGDHGEPFLDVLLPVLKRDSGECHWYDFVADHEFPACSRTRSFIETVCRRHDLAMDVLHVARAGSVAMRQLRVCIDFKISPLESSAANN